MFETFEKPVKCSAGHLYTTIWVPLGSLKSIRLGWKRFQYCPVGKHWAMTSVVPNDAEHQGELAMAQEVHDIRIP